MRRIRFSVRFLLVFLSVFAILFAWLLSCKESARNEASAFSRIQCWATREFDYEDAGASGSPNGPKFLRDILHENVFDRIATLYLDEPSEEDLDQISHFRSLRRLEILHYDHPKMIEKIARADSISSLMLYNVTASSLDGVEELRNLTFLELDSNLNLDNIDAALKIKAIRKIQIRSCAQLTSDYLESLRLKRPNVDIIVTK